MIGGSLKDLVVFDKRTGYAFEGGAAYRYKEVDKKDADAIHRWQVKAFGNKSSYALGFTGTCRHFEKWGPVFEECIRTLKLVPI